jgi:uncharacterized membrane protein YbhN (UPF0104 family)
MKGGFDAARVRRLVIWVVALAALWSLALLCAAVWWGGDALLQAPIGARLVAATSLVFVANHTLRFARWHMMLASEGHHVPLRRSLEAFLAGLALLPTPAKAGVAVRSVLLLEAGVPVHVSLAAYFVERLLDFVGLVMLASLLVGANLAGNRWLLGLAIGIAALLAIAVAHPICRAIRPRIAGLPRIARALDWVLSFLADAAHMLGGWRLPLFLLLGLTANAATGVLLWIALGADSAAVDLAYALGVLGLAHLSGSITMLPGGLGGFEAAMMGALAAANVALPLVVAAVAAVRVVTLWGSVAVGLPLLWLALRRSRATGAAP